MSEAEKISVMFFSAERLLFYLLSRAILYASIAKGWSFKTGTP
jgi:hypothetical protein